MTDKAYTEGGWRFDWTTGSYVYIKPGEYDIGGSLPSDAIICKINNRLIPELLEVLDKEGQLPRRYKNEDREPDLKVVHRLLDILEKK